MHVRDAVGTDAPAVADLLDAPRPVADRLVRERSVVVAEGADDLRGVLAFDADEDAVHVTRLAGDADAIRRLLDEPITFARREGLRVELLVTESGDSVENAVETKGFEKAGQGPRFAGRETTRYRYDGGS